MSHLLYIALGGGLGAVARYLVAKNIQGMAGSLFPLGTLFVNAGGSFLIGFLFYFFENVIVSSDIRSFITIGFLGAYTTFSTYSLETMNLLRNGEIRIGVINVLLSNMLCLGMVIAGMLCSRILFKIAR